MKIYSLKIFFCVTVSILFSYITYSQNPIQWQNSFGGSERDYARAIQETVDGGYIVVGYSRSEDGDVTGNNGGWDYWVVKLNINGTLVWQKSLGGSDNDLAYSIQQTTDGGYIIAGGSTSNNGDVTGNNGLGDSWLVKLDSNGILIWQKSLGGSNHDGANSVQQTDDGGYIVAGFSTSIDGDVTGNHGGYDSWILKLDTDGNMEWQKSHGTIADESTQSIQQTNEGGYIAVGAIGSQTNYDYFILKLDTDGNMEWQKAFGGSDEDGAEFVQQTNDSGYIVAGYSDSIDGDVTGNHGGFDYWIVRLDMNGNLVWQKSLGGNGSEKARSILQTDDGGFIVVGSSSSTNGDVIGNHGGYDYWMIKLDVHGSLIWQKSLGGSDNDLAYSVQLTDDGGYIVAGYSDSIDGDVTGNHGDYDYWVVKLDATIGVDENTYNSDLRVYPNPFISEIQIIGKESLRQMKIYDILGKMVLQEYNNFKQIDVSSLKSGVYLVKIETDIGVITKKIVKE